MALTHEQFTEAMNDPEVRHAIQLLKRKGLTVEQYDTAYRRWEEERDRKNKEVKDIHSCYPGHDCLNDSGNDFVGGF